MLEIRNPNWSDTVQRDPFRGILLSALAVVLLFLSPAARDLPGWLVLDPVFTLVAFGLAFQRIRQAAALEAGIVTAWDTVVSSERDRRIDELLDGPYLLSAYLLPFASVSPLPFAAAWLVVELSTLGHLQLFLGSYRRFRAERGYLDEALDGDELLSLLRWRRRQAVMRATITAALLVSLLVAVLGGSGPDLLGWGTWLALAALSLALFIVDPARSPLYVPREERALQVVEITTPEEVSTGELARLEAVLTHSVATGGVTAAALVERAVHDTTREQGHRLLVARLGDDPVGLLAYQVRDEVGFFWWLATDPLVRRRGVATSLIAHARSELEQQRVIVAESDLTTATPQIRAARLSMLRLLRAQRLVGVQWSSAAAAARYDIFVSEPHGPIGDQELRTALHAAARFSLRDEPEALRAALHRVATASLRRIPLG